MSENKKTWMKFHKHHFFDSIKILIMKRIQYVQFEK